MEKNKKTFFGDLSIFFPYRNKTAKPNFLTIKASALSAADK